MARRTLSGIGRVRRALVAFVAVGLVVIIVISLGAALIIRRVAERHALSEGEQIAERLAVTVVAPTLDAVLNGDANERVDLDRMLDSRMRDGTITEINVWTIDGRIVYAADDDIIGKQFPVTAEVVAAILHGQTSAGLETHPETAPVQEQPQVEVYVPLRLPGRVLAFETYFNYRNVEEQAASIAGQVVPLVVGALVLLQLIQIPIAASLARRVRRHEADRTLLLERALSASEWERKEIAAGIHDGVVQDLAGVGYALGALSRYVPPENREMADRLGATVRNSVAALRRLIVDIYPPDLTESGLAAAVTQLAEPVRAAGMTVLVDIEPLPALDPEVAAALYRTTRETLTNVKKHSDASVVHVWLGPDDDPRGRGAGAVRLRVTDDGVGPPPDALERRVAGHMGLKMVYDRLVELGGDLTLGPGPSGGAVAEARVPARVVGPIFPGTVPPPGGRKPRVLGGRESPRTGSSAAANSGSLGSVTPSAHADARVPMPRTSRDVSAVRGRVENAEEGRQAPRSWPGRCANVIFVGVLAMTGAVGLRMPEPVPSAPEGPGASITPVAHPTGGDIAAAVEEAIPAPAPAPAGVGPATGTMAIPVSVLAAYQDAAAKVQVSDTACGLTWPLLAAIGRIESGHSRGGQVDTAGTTLMPILGPVLAGGPGMAAIGDSDSGRLDGDTHRDRAVGPMQFIPSTWAEYAIDGNGDGLASPHNVYDAVATAARYLCAGRSDLRTTAGAAEAVYRYNHSTDYVAWVLAIAARYASGGAVALPVAPAPADVSQSPLAAGPPAVPVPVPPVTPPPPVQDPAVQEPAAPPTGTSSQPPPATEPTATGEGGPDTQAPPPTTAAPLPGPAEEPTTDPAPPPTSAPPPPSTEPPAPASPPPPTSPAPAAATTSAVTPAAPAAEASTCTPAIGAAETDPPPITSCKTTGAGP